MRKVWKRDGYEWLHDVIDKSPRGQKFMRAWKGVEA